MKTSEKLQQRLKDDLGLEVEIPRRIPRGKHGRSAGQWAWHARHKSFAGDLGSGDTMTECVKAKRISCYQQLHDGTYCICAEDE